MCILKNHFGTIYQLKNDQIKDTIFINRKTKPLIIIINKRLIIFKKLLFDETVKFKLSYFFIKLLVILKLDQDDDLIDHLLD